MIFVGQAQTNTQNRNFQRMGEISRRGPAVVRGIRCESLNCRSRKAEVCRASPDEQGSEQRNKSRRRASPAKCAVPYIIRRASPDEFEGENQSEGVELHE